MTVIDTIKIIKVINSGVTFDVRNENVILGNGFDEGGPYLIANTNNNDSETNKFKIYIISFYFSS